MGKPCILLLPVWRAQPPPIMDVASASFHDGAIRWYENLGDARSWKAHDLRVVKGTQGHYVHAADLDGDGDDDLVAATHGSKAARFSFLRSFSTKGSQAQLGQQNSLVSLDSYAFPTHEKSVTLSAATTRSKMAAMKLQASAGDGDEDALSPV